MIEVLHSVLPIFLITFLGSFIRRAWLKSDEFWRGLEKLSFYVLFPMVLFENSAKVDLATSDFLRLVMALTIAIIIVAGFLVIYQNRTNYDKVQFTSVFQGATRYNNYILFGMTSALFGYEGLTILAVISPYMIVLTNIIAVMTFIHYIPKSEDYLNKKKGIWLLIKSVVGNPFVFASLLGFFFNYAGITLNEGINNTIHTLGSSAFAVGMLLVGSSLRFDVSSENFRQIAFTSFVKLIIMPFVTFAILWLMAISGMAKSVGILFSCMPCASSSYILSRQLRGDPETMSSIITFTTIFSILSLSIFVYILG